MPGVQFAKAAYRRPFTKEGQSVVELFAAIPFITGRTGTGR